MKIGDAFPSNYLKGSDLQGKKVKLVMDRVEIVELDNEQKPVLYFQGKEKGLTLNRTNANTIVLAYGDETESWRGKEIELYFDPTVQFMGKTTGGLRVVVPNMEPPPVEDEDIPF